MSTCISFDAVYGNLISHLFNVLQPDAYLLTNYIKIFIHIFIIKLVSGQSTTGNVVHSHVDTIIVNTDHNLKSRVMITVFKAILILIGI